mgnify:CR=1 FL=1
MDMIAAIRMNFEHNNIYKFGLRYLIDEDEIAQFTVDIKAEDLAYTEITNEEIYEILMHETVSILDE